MITALCYLFANLYIANTLCTPRGNSLQHQSREKQLAYRPALPRTNITQTACELFQSSSFSLPKMHSKCAPDSPGSSRGLRAESGKTLSTPKRPAGSASKAQPVPDGPVQHFKARAPPRVLAHVNPPFPAFSQDSDHPANQQ